MCCEERFQGQPQYEGIFGSTCTYVQGPGAACCPPALAAASSLHNSLLAIRCPSLCLTPSWSHGNFFALRLPSDSGSSQFSTLLATLCTFIARESCWPLGTRHLPVHTPSPLLAAWRCHGALQSAPPRCLRGRRCLAARSCAASLLGALLTTDHPLRCSMIFDLIVTLLATGDSLSS